MKQYIICKPNDNGHGVKFVCSKCDKSLFVNSLCKRTTCMRCGSKFKNKILVERDNNDVN